MKKSPRYLVLVNCVCVVCMFVLVHDVKGKNQVRVGWNGGSKRGVAPL